MFYYVLKAKCQEKGVRVCDIVRAAGSPLSAATNWKNGSYPTLKTVYALAKALGCKPSELVPDEAEPDEAAN